MSDDFEFDDELLDSFDDEDDFYLEDEPEDALDERDRRIQQFEQDVAERRKIILSPNDFKKKERLEAIRWLGEAGAISAIPDLVKVYERDKTSGIKPAAAEALGMLKKLDIDLSDDEIAEQTLEKMERVQLYREFGQKADYGNLRIRVFALTITLVLLLALAAFVPTLKQTEFVQSLRPSPIPSPTPTATPTATPDTPEIASQQLVDYYSALLDDANALQGQLAAATRQQALACDELAGSFANPPDYTLSERRTEQNLVTIAQQLNEASTLIDPVREAFNTACENQEPIPVEDALNTLFESLSGAQALLRQTAPLFEGESVSLPPTLTPSPTPTVTPTPTVDISVLIPQIQTMESIITSMTGLRSPTALLTNYWNDIAEFGRSEGCLNPPFIIPDDFVLPQNLIPAYPDVQNTMQQAADNVNLGLLLLRQANEAFFAACDAGEFPSDTQRFVDVVNTAQGAFQDAQAQLDSVQGR